MVENGCMSMSMIHVILLCGWIFQTMLMKLTEKVIGEEHRFIKIMKKIKSIEIDRISIEGTIDEVVKQFQSYKTQYEPNFNNVRITEESTYEGGYYYYLVGDRLETDEEEAIREKNEAEWTARQEDSLRKQYEALKAKFEPGPCPMRVGSQPPE